MAPSSQLQRRSFRSTTRSFIYDAHNLDRLGENTLLVANYGMGIRMIDTSDKTAPKEVACSPNSNMADACKMDCGIVGRQTWGSYFGSDGLIYASDHARPLLPGRPGGRRRELGPRRRLRRALPGRTTSALSRCGSRGPDAASCLPWPRKAVDAPTRVAIYDVSGRRVAFAREQSSGAPGARSFQWDGRGDAGAPLARGIYFVRAEAAAARRPPRWRALRGDRPAGCA